MKDRLSSHSNSFEGLLSLIPARYYYEDESSSQWKKKVTSNEEKRAAAHKARMNKFDPDVGSSALDEVKRREQLAANEATKDISDEQTVTIYDDRGNAIGEGEFESVNELLRSKSSGAEDNSLVSNQPKGLPIKNSQVRKSSKSASDREGQDDTTASDIRISTSTNLSEPSKATTKASSSQNRKEEPVDSTTENEEGSSAQPPKKPREGIEQLRARLAARVNELKAKRKAPGSDAQGAYKTREELLAARKAKLEQRKKQAVNRDGSSKNDNDMEAEIELDMLVEDENIDSKPKDKEVDPNLMFGQVQFGDGARLSRDFKSLEEERKHKKRNASDQLRVLESRKTKINKLDKTKQDKIAENAKWSRAILQSEGARVRDDESLLKKTIRQKENRKKRSEKEWKQRIYNVKKGVSDREAKRHANISAHKEAKKLRLKGKKRRQHMKAATK